MSPNDQSAPQPPMANVRFEPVQDSPNQIRALTFLSEGAKPVETIVRVVRLRKRRRAKRAILAKG